MYQSNKHINEAFIAVVHSLEKIPIYWSLNEVRLKNILNGKIKTQSYKKCTCDDDYDKVLMFPYFFPIFPTQGQSYLGEYSVLPFFYLIAMNESKAFPIVELVEIPLIHQNIYLSNLEKEKIDSLLIGLGNSHIVSQKRITKENLSQELNKIRKIVMLKVFGFSPSQATIIFSSFSNLPETILLEDERGYLRASCTEQEKISWPFQSTRIVPMRYKNNVFSFTLSSWALSKQEV